MIGEGRERGADTGIAGNYSQQCHAIYLIAVWCYEITGGIRVQGQLKPPLLAFVV